MTTEVCDLGKVQRVGVCREPGDLLGFHLGAFRGERYQERLLDPNLTRLGFFYALPLVPFLPRGVPQALRDVSRATALAMDLAQCTVWTMRALCSAGVIRG
jgi:hypothetical protein